MRVNIILLEHGKSLSLPTYASDEAAGLDLMAAINDIIILKPMQRVLVPCGFCMELPKGFEAQIRPRSGLAFKHGITLVNAPGTIDSDYRGEIKVLLINLGQDNFTIEHGNRIAQMVIAPITRITWQQQENLSTTDRADKGFGSTGVHLLQA